MVYQVKDCADLEKQLTEAGDKLIVIDFYAAWCGPCKFISPKIEELSTVETDVVFLKIDVDECEDIAETYGINSMPTFVFIKNKKQIDTFTGADPNKLFERITLYKEIVEDDEQ